MTILLALHALAAVIWVGGMFFAYMVLRPAAGPLETPARFQLWQRVLVRFFPWVWASVAVHLATGYGMLFAFFGGFAGAGAHIHVMQVTGIVMTLLFMHLYLAPWPRFSRAVAAGSFDQAAAQLNQIRLIVATNLVLGLITVVVGASGRYWP
ncbi:MAG TPA: CopD family protein [Methyloceanibacter sp.]|nr:CopD family protein [Methyloceanibacter sp.]